MVHFRRVEGGFLRREILEASGGALEYGVNDSPCTYTENLYQR